MYVRSDYYTTILLDCTIREQLVFHWNRHINYAMLFLYSLRLRF